jgi:hypothetical protein
MKQAGGLQNGKGLAATGLEPRAVATRATAIRNNTILFFIQDSLPSSGLAMGRIVV